MNGGLPENGVIVMGKVHPIAAYEAKIVLNALRTHRRGQAARTAAPIRKRFDMTVWELHRRGMSDSEIARDMGITASRVRGALKRVECGRYGAIV